MSIKQSLLADGVGVEAQRPWPRIAVNHDGWRQAVRAAAQGQATLTGLWSDGEAVHLGLVEQPAEELIVASLPCPDRRFPSVCRNIKSENPKRLTILIILCLKSPILLALPSSERKS